MGTTPQPLFHPETHYHNSTGAGLPIKSTEIDTCESGSAKLQVP